MKKLIALAAVGFALTACGGPVVEDTQEPGQTEQGLNPTCPAGYTSTRIWECEKVCGANYGNIQHLYCDNASTGDSYDAGPIGAVRCGACY
ncbi:hypothetical protein [Melittangium boletus]|uniref:Lipoprotein n=1 Tax=Melittangium boletus DSM 14713 TaxID=1294270 RepID=A0A250IPI9_9BACT|nr:hypothetical protein [Melittangium boletus]ATB33152.1 hypothetical protein MEBOL_006641 [Melittangium boletus DSM 14713]